MSGQSLPIVTLYGRPGCHLCDQARELLAGLRAGGDGPRFELREVDIDCDERLLREMLELIPVVEVEGVRVSTLLPDPGAVINRLDTVAI